MENQSKLTPEKKNEYIHWGITAFLVIASGILFFFLMFKLSVIGRFLATLISIMQPVIFGFVIAYILLPAAKAFEKRLTVFTKSGKSKKRGKKKQRNYARAGGVAGAVILLVITVYVLLNMIIPELISTITKIAMELPSQFPAFVEKIGEFMSHNETMKNFFDSAVVKASEYIENWLNNDLFNRLNSLISYFAVGVKGVFGVIANLIIGIIIAVYILNTREVFLSQSKKILYAAVKEKYANIIIDVVRQSNTIFSGFISGKILDSLIVGILLFIVMQIFRMPYVLLITVIIGVTNIIPFFGPFIGAIPSVLLVLMISPVKAIYLTIILIVLQQLDGNVIGPKILGQTTGLAPFWVIFAILAGGGLFGFWGMLFGVPVFGVIYYIAKKGIEHILSRKKLPVETSSYLNAERIEEGVIINNERKEI